MAKQGKKVKARYSVNVSMQAWDLAKAGAAVTLRVRDRGALLGTIEIGQGTFGWKSANGKSGFRRVSWSQLAARLSEKH